MWLRMLLRRDAHRISALSRAFSATHFTDENSQLGGLNRRGLTRRNATSSNASSHRAHARHDASWNPGPTLYSSLVFFTVRSNTVERTAKSVELRLGFHPSIQARAKPSSSAHSGASDETTRTSETSPVRFFGSPRGRRSVAPAPLRCSTRAATRCIPVNPMTHLRILSTKRVAENASQTRFTYNQRSCSCILSHSFY